MSSLQILPEVRISKLVYGGRGIGELPDGKKVFVWNALPGELLGVRLIKQRRTYDEAIAEKLIEVSTDREIPREVDYLDTSPWQMMNFEAENRYKNDITRDLLLHQRVDVPTIHGPTHDDQAWHYRNKMEYRFVDDENGIHLALYERASHSVRVVEGSMLAMPAIDKAASAICSVLNKKAIRIEDLKSIIVRSTQENTVAASLLVNTKSFPRLQLPQELKGLRVYYSQPNSSAAGRRKVLYEIGDCSLEDKVLSHRLIYDVDSFFQINLPVFEIALNRIKTYCQSSEVVDMYAGVGSIGLNIATSNVELVEFNPDMAKFARLNAGRINLKAHVLADSTDNALGYIVPNIPVIFDPPRAGLNDKVISKVLAVKPYKIAYLSCDPATQARDLYQLQSAYDISYFEVFNFFPRTPHIETLAILDVK